MIRAASFVSLCTLASVVLIHNRHTRAIVCNVIYNFARRYFYYVTNVTDMIERERKKRCVKEEIEQRKESFYARLLCIDDFRGT